MDGRLSALRVKAHSPCCPPERAASLQRLEHNVFSDALSETFGSRLGRLEVEGPIHAFPLILNLDPDPADGVVIAIGNAAQTLHPVAGQGLNLGLRDAGMLAQTLRHWLGGHPGEVSSMLSEFVRHRRADRHLTASLTDTMSRVFTIRSPLVEHAGGIALLALDLSAGLRHPLARHLLQGLRG